MKTFRMKFLSALVRGCVRSRSSQAFTAIVVGLLGCGCKDHVKITKEQSFEVDAAFTDHSISRGCEEVMWASDSILIATAQNKQIQAFDVNSRQVIWTQKFDKSVDAMTCSSDHVFVAIHASFSSKDEESIRRLDLATGADSTPKGIPQPFLARALVWSEEFQSLCILGHEGLWLYAEDLLSVKQKIPYTGMLPIVTSDGKSVLLAERTESCTLIDLKTGTSSHIHGPVHTGRDAVMAMDLPFLSNAFHATGGSLIRVIDNSWATGRIYFHHTPKDKATDQDSKNGHAVAAVNWPAQRLAVSGTAKNLLLFATDGTHLGELRDATDVRTYSIAISPSGTKIATLGLDGRIHVFSCL